MHSTNLWISSKKRHYLALILGKIPAKTSTRMTHPSQARRENPCNPKTSQAKEKSNKWSPK